MIDRADGLLHMLASDGARRSAAACGINDAALTRRIYQEIVSVATEYADAQISDIETHGWDDDDES